MRRYRAGDGLLRYMLTEPRDAAYALPRRLICRVFGIHTAVCRGRRDHIRPDGSVIR